MGRINTFNRIFTILIFGVVASLTAYGYGSLVMDASSNSALQREYGWYDAYRRLDDTFIAAEVRANIAWAAQPIPGQWHNAVLKQRVTTAEIAALAQRAGKDSDAVALATIAREHAAVVGRAQRVMRMAEHRVAGANVAYRTQVLAAYAALSRHVESLETEHFRAADGLNAGLAPLGRRLERLMIAIGFLGLLLLTGLSYTMRLYRRQADEATQRELRRLEEAALTDSLTGLGNHRAFHEDLAKELSRSRRYGHALTLALLDVDDFKALNDARGHAHGDGILIQTAHALQSGRLEDRAYRIGGDEFAMIFIETTNAKAQIVLNRLRSTLRERLGSATVSIGFCEVERDFDEHDLYERADAALYAAKRNGRDAIVDFAEIREHTTVFSARKSIALRTLLEHRALGIAFQPIWNVARKDIFGFEALARPDPRIGFNGPQEAFDVAERQRRVTDLDRLCVDKIFEAAKGLPANQLIFINITPETLGSADFQAKRLAAATEAAGLQTRQVAIELTERRITDARELVRHTSDLRDLGFLIALDDTGAGSAGLEILSKFTFDFVKIDRSVISEAIQHKRARGVLAGIIAIAAEGGSFVIGEGIETYEQLAFLRNVCGAPAHFSGISGVQGYLLGRPRSGKPDAAAFAQYARVLSGASDSVTDSVAS
jgi:diguanylate cyclase (GGDEF)-like protein